jgi:hypothetical protein
MSRDFHDASWTYYLREMIEHELQTLSEPFPSSLANLQPNNDPIESKQGKRKEQKNPNKRPKKKSRELK